MIKDQYATFRIQTIVCNLIYIPSLVTLLILVNKSMIYYTSTAILSNYDFNVIIGIVVAIGITSLMLAFTLELSLTLTKLFEKDRSSTTQRNHRTELAINVRWTVSLTCCPCTLDNRQCANCIRYVLVTINVAYAEVFKIALSGTSKEFFHSQEKMNWLRAAEVRNLKVIKQRYVIHIKMAYMITAKRLWF